MHEALEIQRLKVENKSLRDQIKDGQEMWHALEDLVSALADGGYSHAEYEIHKLDNADNIGQPWTALVRAWRVLNGEDDD